MNQLLLAQMGGGGGPPPFAPMLLVGALFAIFYFTVIYPQNKKEREKAREKQEFRDRLKKGDEVIAAGARRVAVSAAVVRADFPRKAAAALRAKLDEAWREETG